MMETPGGVVASGSGDEESISSNIMPRGSSMVTSWIVRGSMDD